MKLWSFFLAVCLAVSVQAEPVVSAIEWMPACEGAVIEVARDGAKILGIQASAFTSTEILEWSVHYAEGNPLSAEYRRLKRGRIASGEKVGEYSGENSLEVIHCWKWDGTQFPIEGGELKAESLEILAKVKAEMEKP